MVLRRVRPLNHEEWVAFEAELEKGPSPEQQKAVQNAIEQAKRLKERKY